ncbi:TRM11 family methyltransferase [Cohnella sp. AR92]|uniref:TRM11 family SAM-dependent methyltransferase n=1 Tax=Cohnella sp. AR92 TaxID=648716 RepID=UPI000F8DF538|nr:RNA methyltransferase [Cohnella sp. AR92]RUS49033.1 RNA methyltransferase [Cohnella sp. AR92]
MSSTKRNYLYTYASHEDEESLCRLELTALLGVEPPTGLPILRSPVLIDPSRSPFIRERIEPVCEGDTLEELIAQASRISLGDGVTFKVLFVKKNDLAPGSKIEFEEQRRMERAVGAVIRGRADVHRPDRVFGLVAYERRWYLGPYADNQAVWLKHAKKPREYSIALPARVARAVANIAVPNPDGIKAIDPCCGIGTVLVEARSMGIDIVGRDINPLAAQGARENLVHFGLSGEVSAGAIEDVRSTYDVAIVDLPYNHVTRISEDVERAILQETRRIARRAVIISHRKIEEELAELGFAVESRCESRKGASFVRHIAVCR